MRKDPIGIGVPLVLALGLIAAPTAASADELHDRQGEARPGGFVPAPPGGFAAAPPGGFAPAPSFPRPSVPHPVHPHRFRHRPSGPFGFPAAVYPFGFYDSPDYYYSPPGGDPPSAYAQPNPPPTPDVIEYPTGRYELRGDGVYLPYTWVWVPNPPLSPPEAAPTEKSETTSEAPVPADPSPTPHEAYRWTDEQGSVYWTDRWDSIPEQYRAQAKRLSL